MLHLKQDNRLLLTLMSVGLLFLLTTNSISNAGVKLKETTTQKEPTTKKKLIKLKSDKLGQTRNVHTFGKTILCGQPSATDFAEAKKRGIKVILSVRTQGEVNWDEKAAVEKAGLKFEHIPFRTTESLNDKVFAKTLKLLANQKKEPVLFHCGSANRVGAIWATHRVLNDGLSIEAAFKEGKEVGLRNMEYAKKAIKYIHKQQAKKKIEN